MEVSKGGRTTENRRVGGEGCRRPFAPLTYTQFSGPFFSTTPPVIDYSLAVVGASAVPPLSRIASKTFPRAEHCFLEPHQQLAVIMVGINGGNMGKQPQSPLPSLCLSIRQSVCSPFSACLCMPGGLAPPLAPPPPRGLSLPL